MSNSIRHPSWCDLSECTVRQHHRSGTHLSTPVLIVPAPDERIHIQVQLYHGVLRVDEPVLVFIDTKVADPDSPANMTLPIRLRQARLLAYALATLARRGEAG